MPLFCWLERKVVIFAVFVKAPLFLAGDKRTVLDNRQITHLICVRLKHLLYDLLGGVLGLLPVLFLYKRPTTPP